MYSKPVDNFRGLYFSLKILGKVTFIMSEGIWQDELQKSKKSLKSLKIFY